jgi:hypothetical protein
MTERNYNAEELAQLTKVVGAIEMNLSVKPAEDTEYPFELLESLLWGIQGYIDDALASQLAHAMFELGAFASENNLSINAYQLSEDLYKVFTN